MEFHEKLQELRKSRGMTQEELAEALFVSRTAISKWETGRGYPNIDSLKEISRFYGVTIDALLSGERIISLAEKENKAKLSSLCNLLIGVIDLLALSLIVLPLYPKRVENDIFSVNFLEYTDISALNRAIDWGLIVGLIAVGAVKILLSRCKIERGQAVLNTASVVISVLGVLFFAMSKEPYAVTVIFLLLMVKGIIFFESVRKRD